MNKILSFIIGAVFSFVLTFHNPVMVFGDEIPMSMGNHSSMSSDSINGDCHEDNSLSDCESVCCYGEDENYINYKVVTSNNFKKYNKLKISFYELSFDSSYIYEWGLIGNISPPGFLEYEFKDSYIEFVGIIKSNT